MKKSLFVAGAAALMLSGCASIFNGKTQEVTVSSVPEGAIASVTNGAGDQIHTGATPVTLTLNRGQQRVFVLRHADHIAIRRNHQTLLVKNKPEPLLRHRHTLGIRTRK